MTSNTNTSCYYNSNGRVDIKSPSTQNLFNLYDKIPAHQCTTYRNPLQGILEDTVLSNVYFSRENLEIIQNAIRKGIYDKTNGKYIIDNQDCDSLKTIMRGVYLEHSVNQPSNITQQIVELNKMVINFCVQQIYSELRAYIQYLHDASTLVVPIAHPTMSTLADKQLELKPWF
jgi:hypothetical protein